MGKKWYKIQTRLGHQGAGKSQEINVYVYVIDIIKALQKHRYIPGIKKKYKSSNNTFK